MRYGATDYAVYRSQDDRYKFLADGVVRRQAGLRALLVRGGVQRASAPQHASWYQVPVLYYFNDW